MGKNGMYPSMFLDLKTAWVKFSRMENKIIALEEKVRFYKDCLNKKAGKATKNFRMYEAQIERSDRLRDALNCANKRVSDLEKIVRIQHKTMLEHGINPFLKFEDL